MTVIEAIRDPALFKPFFGDSLRTWRPWLSALRVFYGLPIMPVDKELIKQCTGRSPLSLPKDGFSTAVFLTGRRSGKSRIAATIGAYEAVLAGHEKKLSKGEQGIVPIISPTKRQSGVVKKYLRAIFQTPLLSSEVVSETSEGFELQNGVSIEVLAGDFRSVRNFTLLAAIVDEAAFFGLEAECKIKSDTELIRALKPGLATTSGKLIAISSPYAARGFCYRAYKANFGNDAGRTLVWNCPSRTMNETLPQSVIDDAMIEDRASALSEYGGQFRDDIQLFVPREAIERLVPPGRKELMPRESIRYYAFTDPSGGRADDWTLGIGHKLEGKSILDFIARWKPPFNPQQVIEDIVKELKRWNLKTITGDNYSAEFVKSAFQSCGIKYTKSEKPKSELYRELLPMIFSDKIELLDDETLINQLSGLERRTRSGGKDIIDHPQGSKDDVANVVAGLANCLAKPVYRIGGF